MDNTKLLGKFFADTPLVRSCSNFLNLFRGKFGIGSGKISPMPLFVFFIFLVGGPAKIVRMAVAGITIYVSNFMFWAWRSAVISRANYPVNKPFYNNLVMPQADGRVAVFKPRLHYFASPSPWAGNSADNGPISINRIFGGFSDNAGFVFFHFRNLHKDSETNKVFL